MTPDKAGAAESEGTGFISATGRWIRVIRVFDHHVLCLSPPVHMSDLLGSLRDNDQVAYECWRLTWGGVSSHINTTAPPVEGPNIQEVLKLHRDAAEGRRDNGASSYSGQIIWTETSSRDMTSLCSVKNNQNTVRHKTGTCTNSRIKTLVSFTCDANITNHGTFKIMLNHSEHFLPDLSQNLNIECLNKKKKMKSGKVSE